jgi:hypothetical protein
VTCPARCGKPHCRRARPLCRRKDNPRNLTCECGGYPFPHRVGSALCRLNPSSQARMWDALLAANSNSSAYST